MTKVQIYVLVAEVMVDTDDIAEAERAALQDPEVQQCLMGNEYSVISAIVRADERDDYVVQLLDDHGYREPITDQQIADAYNAELVRRE